LNAFVLDDCVLKIKVFYSYLQHHGIAQATGKNRSNFQILLDCIVTNGIFKKYYYITLTCTVSLRYRFGTFKTIWPMTSNQGF